MQNTQRQGSHMYVLTLQNRHGATCTFTGTHTPPEGWTRFDVHDQLRAESVRSYPSMEGATVLFFSLEPNTL
ncbi:MULTISPECIES: hypothetical protein [Streptomyces]|uniref:Uncharacterized protein n=1 Tax=Streptomyces venezuelae TaxID=54571 RepID=A0A5P2AS51_STRVZ|nr:hypothetical protein [Streptomyces venezuelae]QES20440.1 hypothetical protein DEJ46_16020 [Streptomyces venezuelae]QES23480.1 hypothetical protein DEJ46_33735 [Streptomyces venezuelae]